MGKFGTLRKKTGVRSSGTFWRLSLWFGSMGFSCRGFPPPPPKKIVQKRMCNCTLNLSNLNYAFLAIKVDQNVPGWDATARTRLSVPSLTNAPSIQSVPGGLLRQANGLPHHHPPHTGPKEAFFLLEPPAIVVGPILPQYQRAPGAGVCLEKSK